MHRKSLSLALVVVLLVSALPVLGAASASESTYTIGLSLPTIETLFYSGVSNGALAAAEERDVDLVVVEANNDLETEQANIQALVDQGVDALLISPTDPVESLAAIAAANEAGIPVFLISPKETDLASQLDVDIVSTLMPNNRRGGELAGLLLCRELEEGDTVVVLDNALDGEAVRRSDGFNAYMAEHCAGVTVLPLETANLDHAAIVDDLSNLLSTQDVDGLFLYDEQVIQPSLDAKLAAGKLRGVTSIGFGLSDNTMAAVQNNHLLATVAPSGWSLGKWSLITSIEYLTGEKEVASQIMVDLGVLDSDLLQAWRGGGNGPNQGLQNGQLKGDPRSTEGDPRSTEGDPRSTEGDPRSTEGDPRSTEGDNGPVKGDPRSTE